MQSIDDIMAHMGLPDHITAEPGDFIGDDDLVHCGVCGKAKEHRLKYNGRFVPIICQCRMDELAREEAEQQRQMELKRVNELAAYSLIDERFRESTFDNFIADTPEDQHVLRICRNYVDHWDEMLANNAGLLFYGSPGTGKTFAASCIANALMERRVPVLVTSIVRLTADTFGDDLNELLYRMNTARLLVLDDFGAERETSTKAEQVFSVIDARYSAKKPMIITTNLKDFKTETNVRRLRVYDRIFEVCKPVKMDGESKRRAEGQKKRDSIRAILEG
ncbi:MAG: ATP-binding protein [Clostridia bacterium]|nr:ATP-binding protein [Clostridia bacterium]